MLSALLAVELLSCLVGAGKGKGQVCMAIMFLRISSGKIKSLVELNDLETCSEDIENLLRSRHRKRSVFGKNEIC